MSTLLQDYRNTIYLNNAGVALLKAHSYLEAKQVLLDAIEAARLTQLRRTLTNNTISTSLAWGENANMIMEAFHGQEKILQANHFLSKKNKNHHTAAFDEIVSIKVILDTDFEGSVVLEELRTSHNDELSLCNIPPTPTTSGVCCVYPISIESAAFNTDLPTEIDLDLISSIIIYNYALTYHVLACRTITLSLYPSIDTSNTATTTTTTTTTTRTMIQWNIAAYKLFHASYSIVSTLCNSAMMESGGLLNKIITMASLNLKYLISIGTEIFHVDNNNNGITTQQGTTHTHHHHHTQEYHHRLVNYQTYLEKQTKLFRTVTFPPAA